MATRSSLLALILFVFLASLAPAFAGPEDEEAAARDYARKQLVRQAQRMAGEGSISRASLDALRRALTEDINFLTATEPKSEDERQLLDTLQLTVEERVLLLGEPAMDDPDGPDGPEVAPVALPSGPDEGLEGAAGEAVRLLRWLRGEEACGVVVETVRGDTVVGKPRPYQYDPKAKRPGTEPAPPAAPKEGEGTNAGTAGAAAPPVPEGGAPAPADAKPAEEKPAPPKEEAPKKTEPPPPPAPPLTPLEWAREIVLAKEGTFLDKHIRPDACSAVSDLLQLAQRPVTYLGPEGRSLRRRVVASAEPFTYNLPFVRLRELQATQRQLAISEEAVAGGLVDESLVREKTRRAAQLREVADRVRAERERLIAFLDQMTVDMGDWREQAAILSGRIQKEKRRLAETLTPQEREAGKEAEDSLLLRVMEAQEAVVSLDLRLFFHTVLRAEYRLGLLRDYLSAVETVAQSAEAKRDEFGRALDQVRNERQIDRLRSEAHLMRRGITHEEKRKETSKSDRPQLRIDAYTAILEVNRIVQETVARRRVASAPRLAQEQEEAEARTTPRNAKPLPPPEPGGAKPPSAEAQGLAETDPKRKLSAIARNPFLHVWGLSTVYALAGELKDPTLRDAYDANLISDHYSAASVQVEALQRALTTTMGDAELRQAFEAAYAKAEAALAPLEQAQDFVGTTLLRPALDTLRTDFEHSLDAIAVRRKEHEEHLEALRAYRHSLLELGPLSLAIRTNKDLDGAELLQAAMESVRGVREAQQLFDPANEQGILGFATRNVVRVLIALTLLVGVVVVVRKLRGRIDTWLDREAARIPNLRWSGASVRQERRSAQERKRREDEAARAATEAARLQATAPPPEVSAEPSEEEVEDQAAADVEAEAEEGEAKTTKAVAAAAPAKEAAAPASAAAPSTAAPAPTGPSALRKAEEPTS